MKSEGARERERMKYLLYACTSTHPRKAVLKGGSETRLRKVELARIFFFFKGGSCVCTAAVFFSTKYLRPDASKLWYFEKILGFW